MTDADLEKIKANASDAAYTRQLPAYVRALVNEVRRLRSELEQRPT